MADDFDSVDAARDAERAGLERMGADLSGEGVISAEDLEVLCHAADDRLLALTGREGRMLGADEYGALVQAYLIDRRKPDVTGEFGLARAKLLMGIVDGLRSFTSLC